MSRFLAGTFAGRRWSAAALSLLAGTCAMHGCTSPTAPQPPGGGKTLSLSYAVFQSTIEPILSRQGCDAGGDCHGGGVRGTLELSPVGAKDPLFDFNRVALETNAYVPDSSLVLRKPLAVTAGGLPHSFKPFASVSDADYQAIRQWILAGVQP